MKLSPFRFLLFLLFLCLFTAQAWAQTITIGSVDPGPYSPGSSIAVPINVSGCVPSTTTYTLYISDDPSFGTKRSIGTFDKFYATFVNGILPTTGTFSTPGSYYVRVEAGSIVSAAVPVTTIPGAAVTASIRGVTINLTGTEVFSNCNNSIASFKFTDNSTNATAITTTLHDEYAPNNTPDATLNPAIGSDFTFPTTPTNYTLLVKAGNGTTYGTKAYSVINNVENNSFGTSGNPSACLGSDLTFNVDYTSANGIQFNYPGNTYKFDWGDGNNTVLTFCQIAALTGHVSHGYSTSSCGSVVGNQVNVFKVGVLPISPYCGSLTEVSTTAKILSPPTNAISSNNNNIVCAGTPASFFNGSYPGSDPNSTTACSQFAGATYTWLVDGVVYPGFAHVSLSTVFKPILSAGGHVITLQLDNNQTGCGGADATLHVCAQDPPAPSFTLASNLVCSTSGVVIHNTSTFDQTCALPTYNWTLTNAVTNAIVATSTDFEPQFTFPAAGTYKITLAMPDACGNSIPGNTATLKVDATPTATLSLRSGTYCGPQTFAYNASSGTQRVAYGGTADPATATYQWTVTTSGAAPAYSFISGTATSQNPQIRFTGVGDYTVTVTQTNSCGTSVINALSTQTITIQQAPSVDIGPDATICAGQPYLFNATISDPSSVQTYTWSTNGHGQFSDLHALSPIYTPGGTDLTSGTPITLTLNVATNLVGLCSLVQKSMNLTVTPTDIITSASAQSICTGNSPNYQITASNTGSTFTWTSALTSGSATGFNQQTTPVSGTDAIIADVLINNSSTNDAVVTYTITPTSNGCPGTSFVYTVTIHPLPVLTLPTSISLCSGNMVSSALDLSNASNLANTKYTWIISTLPSGVAVQHQPGNTQPASTINDILTNSGTTDQTVTYTITPSAGGCPGTSVPVDIVVHPQPTLADAGLATATICNSTTFTFNATPATVGSGKWTLNAAPGQTGITFVDDTNPATMASGLVPGEIYKFVWTVSSSCNTTSDNIVVTDNLLPVGGTATAVNNITTICYGDNANLTLTGQTGTVIRWEQSVNGGGFSTVPGTSAGTTYTYSGLTQTTTFHAVVTNGACTTPTFSNSVTVMVNPPTPAASINNGTTPSIELCNQSNTALSGNLPPNTTGKWTVDQAGVIFNDDTNPNVTISGLVGGQTYKFTWTLTGLSPCGPTSAIVTLTDRLPISNNAVLTPTDGSLVCALSDLTLTASTPTGGDNTYTYQWQQSTDNGASWTDISGQTAKNATVTIGNQNTAYRRIVKSGTCNDASTPITIDIEAAIGDNTLPISAEICYNTIPAEIAGSQPTGGDNVNYTYQWQQSTSANTGFTDILNANGINYTPTQQLTVTTYYRRIVSTPVCNGATSSISAPIKVIVDPEIKAIFTAQLTGGCAPFNLNQLVNGTNNITVVGDPNIKTYSWYINAGTQPIYVSSTPDFPPTTLQNDGESITITLIVTNAHGCQAVSNPITFTAINRVTAGFTTANTSVSQSGAQTYQFTNTSTPPNAATYLWDFGDGTTSTAAAPPDHVFAADEANGTDKVYTVKLTATTACSVNSATQQFTVYPSTPHALIDPGVLTGCAPYTITARNLSPGTNSSYTFYLYDGATLVQQITKTDKSDVSFASVSPTSTKTYTLYMVATNLYEVTGRSVSYPITVNPSTISASMTVLGSGATAVGCAPFNVTFQNLSNGGNSYVYNIYDSNSNPIEYVTTNSTGDQSHAFNAPGTYYVDISVISNCTTAQSQSKIKIIVNPLPSPAFSTDGAVNCAQTTVSFVNTTPDGSATATATSYTYLWDFGDGTTSNLFTPLPHTYDYTHSPYTVKLTATNADGCSATTIKNNFITVSTPAGTDFTALPDTIISIPNYHFSFVDKSTGNSVSWSWDFGDGSSSTERNPEHTYADTGKYKVTLITTTSAGCSGTKTHTAQVTGVPGQLYVPNAFMPTSLNTELRVFTVKGSGIKQWDMRIYDNWGGLIFETTKLNSKGEPVEFWDGRYKGQEMQQGGYAWEISATFINGTDWRGMSYKGSAPKKAGVVNLIR